MRRTLVTGFLMGVLCASALCQSNPSKPVERDTDASAYRTLFQRILLLTKMPHSTGSKDPARARLHSAMDLTDKEADQLIAVSADYLSKLHAFDMTSNRSYLDARIKLAESQSPETLEVIKSIDEQRKQIVLDHVQQLSTAFGDARFKVLDGLVRAGVFLSESKQ
jgi:hypothetical protein